jgi:PAS domain S-box-containing protein
MRQTRESIERLKKNLNRLFVVTKPGRPHLKKLILLGAIPAAILALFTVLVVAFDLFSGTVSSPPNLLLALNLIFITGTNVTVALLSARSYLKNRSLNVLALGCGLLLSGLAALFAGWATGFSSNAGVTIYNIGLLFAGGAQFLGGLQTLRGNPSSTIGGEKGLLIAAYSATIAFSVLVSAIAVDGLFPEFFTSAGPTLLREIVLGMAACLFAITFLVYVRIYLKSRSGTLFFYTLGLGAVALGLFGTLFITQLNGVIAWLARIGQYLGGLYFLLAVVYLRMGSEKGIGFSGAWTETFSGGQQELETLFSKMLNGFSYQRIVTDKTGKPVDYLFLGINEAFEKMTGLKRKNVIGKKVTEVLPGIDKDPANWIGVYGRVALTGQPIAFENYAEPLRKWYSVSSYSPRRGYFVAIFEDITDRKNAEKEIRNLAKFPAENPDPVFRIARDGTLTYFNGAAMQVMDASVWKVKESVPESWRLVVNNVFNAGNRLEFEGQMGEKIFLFVVSPLTDYVNVYGHDITKRKKAEEALRDLNEELEERVKKRTKEVSSERQRLYNVLETLPAYVILLDKDYCVPFANKIFRERFGESHGRQCYDFLFKRESPCENCETYKVLKTNGPHRWEWTGPDSRDYDIYDFPFEDSDDSKLILEMGIDITERKRAEKQLRDTSLYARSLLEASLDPLVTINAEGKITDVNQATELATGYSRDELIGSDFSDYFTDKEKARIGYKQVFTEGYVRDYPLAIRHKSGKTTEVLYNAAIYTNEAGEMQGVFAAARDITELRKAEAQAQEAAKKLKDAERLAAIGATAGMVGHDIRNPLQAITSDVYLAKVELASVPDAECKTNALESLTEIEKNISYINKIVQDLQDYARPLNPAAKEIDLQSVIEDLIKKNGIPDQIKVSVKVPRGAASMMADPDIIRRVLANLVTNAVQAMPEGGKLTLRTAKEADETVITVQDTGVGIPEEARAKLFTPLFTTKSKGQGFGLAVVKRMIEAMNGTITFDSEIGKGTTFIVRLPPPKELNGKWTFK